MWRLTRRTVTGSFRSLGRDVDYRYNPKTDTLWLLIEDRPVAYSTETSFGLIDFDADDDIVAIQIFGASEAFARSDKITPQPQPDLSKDLLDRVNSYVREAREHVKIGAPS
jgi:uncharacterized protein YuzE